MTTTRSNAALRAPAVVRASTVLVAEESTETLALLADNLTADGFRVRSADSRAGALAILTEEPVDVIVVDVNGDTLGLIDTVRGDDDLAGCLDRDVPVIALTGKADAVHRTRLLDRGADDVLGKPFSYPELRSRIAAILRRAQRRPAPPRVLLEVAGLLIDPVARTVRVDGQLVELTGREYALLRTLASDPTRVFTRAELLRDVWGFPADDRSRTLDGHACRLRRKLADAGAGHLVQNVWGIGYRLTSA